MDTPISTSPNIPIVFYQASLIHPRCQALCRHLSLQTLSRPLPSPIKAYFVLTQVPHQILKQQLGNLIKYVYFYMCFLEIASEQKEMTMQVDITSITGFQSGLRVSTLTYSSHCSHTTQLSDGLRQLFPCRTMDAGLRVKPT